MADYLINDVYPWGRSLAEYERMFALTPVEMQGAILDCGGGPASFNAELTARGGKVVSCDPLYQFSREDIERRVQESRPVLMENVRQNKHLFVWTSINSVEQLEETRMGAMQLFLKDYQAGLLQQRYISAMLPELPFEDGEFSLAVVSHLLFLYSQEYDTAFHVDSLRELLRAAREVRVFPVLGMKNVPSPHLMPVIDALTSAGYNARLQTVDYEFMVGGNQMLVVAPSTEIVT